MRQRNIKNMGNQPGIEQFSLLYTTLNLFLSLKPSISNHDLAGAFEAGHLKTEMSQNKTLKFLCEAYL